MGMMLLQKTHRNGESLNDKLLFFEMWIGKGIQNKSQCDVGFYNTSVTFSHWTKNDVNPYVISMQRAQFETGHVSYIGSQHEPDGRYRT